MAERVCLVCGRSVEDLGDAREGESGWFCSEGHFLEWEARIRYRRRRRVRSGLLVAALALVIWFAFHKNATAPELSGTAGFIQAAKQLDETDKYLAKHPVVLRVSLTSEALRVADAFVTAEYVRHDCKTLGALTSEPQGLRGESFGPIGQGNCTDSLQLDRQNDSHLVRGSRTLERSRCEVAGFDAGSPLWANECVRYATEGRYITLASGKRLHECDGSFFQVFLSKIGGRWRVVAEKDSLDWGGGCDTRDIAFWKRAEPWTAR